MALELGCSTPTGNHLERHEELATEETLTAIHTYWKRSPPSKESEKGKNQTMGYFSRGRWASISDGANIKPGKEHKPTSLCGKNGNVSLEDRLVI